MKTRTTKRLVTTISSRDDLETALGKYAAAVIEGDALQAEIDEMDREIDNLRNNRDSLESFARETYHFAAPGDDIYIVEE